MRAHVLALLFPLDDFADDDGAAFALFLVLFCFSFFLPWLIILIMVEGAP